ncbi:hypothetical protein [Lentilactobacillus senioris]
MNEFQKQLLSELCELNKTLKVIASNQERRVNISDEVTSGIVKAFGNEN